MKGAIITMKKKLWLILLLFMLFACSNKTKSPFIEDEEGHKMYKNEDGIYVKNDWYEIDGNKYYLETTETGVRDINTDTEMNVHEMLRYTIDGRMIRTAQPGVNIIRMSDGSTKKVLIK